MKGIATTEQQRRGYARGGQVPSAPTPASTPAPSGKPRFKVEHVVKPLKRGGPARRG